MLSVALISLNGAGTAGSDGSSRFGDPSASDPPSLAPGQSSQSLSADGSLMVFQSDATNMVAGVNDTNTTPDVFVRNLKTGQTELVSVTPDGQAGNGRSFQPSISADGRYVAFLSTSTNLSSVPVTPSVPGAGTEGGLLYLRDLKTGTTTLLDATPDGQAADGFATGKYAFSPDGTNLAFTDTSTNLSGTPNPDGGSASASSMVAENVYIRNLAAGTTTLVTVTPGGMRSQGNLGNGSTLAFSADGTKLAFSSTATDLTGVPSGSTLPNNANLYVRDLTAGTTTAISVTPGNVLSSGAVTQAVFGPDGHSLAFVSTGTDLTADASDPPLTATGANGQQKPSAYGASNVFVRNLSAGTTMAVSVTPGGKRSNGFAGSLRYSPDGQSLAYLSSADDLTTNPTPPLSDTAPDPGSRSPLPFAPMAPPANLFFTNLATRGSTLVSVTPTGTLSSGDVFSYAFSPDGTKLAFDAVATDLTNNPPLVSSAPATVQATSSVRDNVFVRDLPMQVTTLISASPDGTLATDSSFAGSVPISFSPDGQTLYFGTDAPLAANDMNGMSDLYAATAPFTTSDQVHFVTWKFDANESDGQATITVVRNAPLDGPASVDYSIKDGTAKAGNDFQSTSGTVNFAPGQAAATFSIPLNGAASFANAKNATITLANSVGAPLGFPTATLNLTGIQPIVPVTITNTDSTPHKHKKAHGPVATPTPATPTPTTSIDSPAPTAPTPVASTTSTVPANVSGIHTVYAASVPATPPPSGISTTPTPGVSAPTTSSGSTNAPATSTAGTNVSTTSTAGTNATAASTTGTTSSTTSTAGTTVPATGAAGTTPSAASVPGPVVTSVAVQTSHRRINQVIINFNESVADAGAGNVANFRLNLLSPGRRTKHGVHQATVGGAIGVSSASYDPSTQKVTLTLGSPLRTNQMFQLRINGGTGGISNQAGNALNSASRGTPGSDFVYNVNQRV